MGRHKPKSTPRQRLAAVLKQKTSQIESIREFRRKLHNVLPLITNPLQLDAWLDAREQMGLHDDPDVRKVSDDIVRLISAIEVEALGLKEEKPKKRVDNTDALNRRESERRANLPPVGYRCTMSMESRMAQGFDKRLDELIRYAQRSG